MKPVCTVGDKGEGICKSHKSPTKFTTTFTKGNPHSSADGKDICVVGSIGEATCGHKTIATEGSSFLSDDGIAVHCVGHKGKMLDADGEYTATTGSGLMQSD